MAREKEGYRMNIELLNEAIPDRLMLSKSDVSRVLGMDRKTVVKKIRFNNMGLVSKADLARQISV